MGNLTRVPPEEDMFDWLVDDFWNWPRIKEEVRHINRAAHGHPTRTFNDLWFLVEEEVAFRAFEINLKHDKDSEKKLSDVGELQKSPTRVTPVKSKSEKRKTKKVRTGRGKSKATPQKPTKKTKKDKKDKLTKKDGRSGDKHSKTMMATIAAMEATVASMQAGRKAGED
eukprot:294979-Karenia_brevis.AAC.1